MELEYVISVPARTRWSSPEWMSSSTAPLKFSTPPSVSTVGRPWSTPFEAASRISAVAKAGKHDPEDAVAGTQPRPFNRVLEHGHLLSQCEVLNGGRSAAHDERPEEEKDGLEDAHRLSLPRLRNGQSY